MIYLVPIGNGFKLITVTFNSFEYVAFDDETFEPGSPIGFGRTIAEAANDWRNQQ